jgi:hypothetical protein
VGNIGKKIGFGPIEFQHFLRFQPLQLHIQQTGLQRPLGLCIFYGQQNRKRNGCTKYSQIQCDGYIMGEAWKRIGKK